MPLVDVDGIGTVSFPDEMSSEDISGAIRQHLSRARSAGLQATVSAGLLPAQILTAPGVAEASEMGQQQGRMSRFLSTPEELPPATNEERSARDALLAPTSDEAFLQNINTPRAMRIAGIRRAQEASTPSEFTPSPEAIQSAYNETARWVNPPKAAIQTAWGALREAQQSVGLPEAPDPNAKLLPPGAAKNIVDFWADSLMPSDVGGNLGPAGEGIKQAATDVLEGMTKGDAATMLTGPVGGAGYALEMAHGAPDQAAQLGQAVGSGDAQSASKALANLAFSVVAPGELVHGMARLASPRSIPIPDYPGARIESPQGARVPRAEAPAPLETVSPEVSAAQALRMTREATGEEPVNAAQFRAPKPTVPEAGIEPIPPTMTEHAENLTGLNLQIDQVVRAGAKTKEAIRELFPDMNRQQAAQLRDLVWNSPESGPGKALLDSLFRKPYLEDPKLGDAMNEAEMFRRAEDMINKAKEQNAKAIRGNQGQLPESGSTAEGGEAVSRNDVQPPPPGESQSVVQGEAPSAPEVKTLDDLLGMTPAQISAWRKGTDPVEFGKSKGWNVEDVKAARDRLQKENADALEKIKALPPEQQPAKLAEWVANNEKAHALQEIVKGAEGENSPRAIETVAEGMTLAEIKRKMPVGFDPDSIRIENGKIIARQKPEYGGKEMVVSLKKATAEPLPAPAFVFPKAGTPEWDALPMGAKSSAGEYAINQKIIDTGLHPDGKKASKKQIAELIERQKQVIENYKRNLAAGKPPKPAPVNPENVTSPGAPAAPEGELLAAGPQSPVANRPEVARNRIVRVLEQLEDEDPRTGKMVPSDIADEDFPAVARQAAQALGMDWGKLLAEHDQASLTKLLRTKLKEIEQSKLGKKLPPHIPDEPAQAATPGLAMARTILRDHQAGNIGDDDLAQRILDAGDVHDLPEAVKKAAEHMIDVLGDEEAEPGAKHRLLSELAKALGEKAPEAPKVEPEEVTPPVSPVLPVEEPAPAEPAAEPTPPPAPVEEPTAEEPSVPSEPSTDIHTSPKIERLRQDYKAAAAKAAELQARYEHLDRKGNLSDKEIAERGTLGQKMTEAGQKAMAALDALQNERWRQQTEPYRVPGYKAAEGEQPVSSKMLKEQKASLLEQARTALKNAPDDGGTQKITLSVPGDGDFSIFNNKESLKKFIGTVDQHFPESVAKPSGPGLASGKGKAMPAATPLKPAKGKTMGETMGQIAGEFTSEDETRPVLHTAYSDGTQIIATDGRTMIRVVSPDAPGKPSRPVRLNASGKITEGEGSFPNYKQIWDEKPDLVRGGVATADLWTVANQALALFKGLDEGKNAPRVELFVNPDGTIGAHAEAVGVGEYSHNVKPDAKSLGAYNAKYLLRIVEAARKLGNDKADLYRNGAAGSALEVRGKNMAALVMPMKIGEKFEGAASFPNPGKAEHGRLPEMLGVLKSPDEKVAVPVTLPGGSRFEVSLENGKYKVDRITDSKTGGVEPIHTEITSGKVADIAQWAKDVTDLGPAAKTGIGKAIKEALTERGNRIAEADKRESGTGGGKLQDALDSAAEDALKRIRSREGGTTFGSGPLHELPNIKDYAIYGAAKLAKYGIRSAAWTKDMLDAFGKRIQPHLDAIFDAAKAHLEDFRRQTAKIGRATDVQQIIAENTGATREQPSNITQAVSALQTSLRTVRALQEHFTGGAKISKAELKVADDWLEADTNNIRQSLSDLVKRELPPEERGRFLTAILNATKRPSLLRPEVWVKGEGKVSAVEQMYRRAAEVAARIEDRSQEVVKAQVIGDLRDTVKRALSSPAVDIGYKSKILDLMKRVSFTKPTAETIAALKGTRDFLDRMAAQGKDVDMPREVLDQLEVLTKVPLRDMSPDAVRALAANISRLEEMGRLKVKARQAVWDAEKNSKLTELGQEPTTPIEKNPMLGHQPGDVDSATTKIRNYLRRTLNAAQLIDKALMPIDALFDMMGDRKGNYRGWLFKNVRGPLDLGFNAASVMRDRVNQPIVDLIKKYKMGEREAERIGTYAISLQDGGRERLIEMGVDPKRIDDISKNLSPQEKAVYLQMRQAMDGLLPQLQKTMHELYNIDVKPVENYFPMPRDWEKMREIESPKPAKEPLFGTPMSFDELAGWKDMLGDFFPPKKTATERGFTIERVPKAMTPIKLNAFDTFYQHINDATYLLKTQRDLKMIGEMARNGGFEQKYGKFGQSLVLDFLDTFARQGRLGGMRRVPWLDELRTRSSAGIIGLRVASQFVHASNIALAAQRAGMDNYRAAMAQIASSPRARQFIADNFAEAFARGGGEPAMVEAASKDMSVFGKTIVPEKLVRASMVVARTIDRYNAEATMLGVYFKELRNKGIDPSTYLDRPVDPEAQAHAMVLARRAVASPLPKDVPMGLSRGMLTGGNISLGRTLGQFQNIFLDQWSNIRHDLWRAGIREKNPKKAFAMFIAMAGTIFIENAIRSGAKSAIQGVTGAPPSKHEPGTREKVMSEAVRRFPFGGQATAMLLYGRSGIPSIDLMMETAKAAHTVATTKNPHAGNRALVKAAGGVGQLMGVPGSGQSADIVSQSIK